MEYSASNSNLSDKAYPSASIISSSTKQASIIDIPLSKGKNQVSLSAFAFLYSEIVQRAEKSTLDYEKFISKLSILGRHVGMRAIELLVYRESGSKREIDRISMLQFITKTVWKSLFNRQIPSDGLLKVNDDEFRIVEQEPITNIYVSSKKGTATTMANVAAFIGGIIEGVLNSGGFVRFLLLDFFFFFNLSVQPSDVMVAFQNNGFTVYVIRFRKGGDEEKR
jgi:hypothetical protein